MTRSMSKTRRHYKMSDTSDLHSEDRLISRADLIAYLVILCSHGRHQRASVMCKIMVIVSRYCKSN